KLAPFGFADPGPTLRLDEILNALLLTGAWHADTARRPLRASEASRKTYGRPIRRPWQQNTDSRSPPERAPPRSRLTQGSLSAPVEVRCGDTCSTDSCCRDRIDGSRLDNGFPAAPHTPSSDRNPVSSRCAAGCGIPMPPE